jgi:hypothetical protein
MTTIGGTGSAHHPLRALWVHELQHARAHRPLQAQWVSEMTTVGGTGSAHHPVPALRVSELSHARARHPVRTGAALLRQRGRLCRLAAMPARPRRQNAQLRDRTCRTEKVPPTLSRRPPQFSPAPTYASPPSSESESLSSSPSGFSSTGCPYPSTAKHASVSAAVTATTGAPSGCRDSEDDTIVLEVRHRQIPPPLCPRLCAHGRAMGGRWAGDGRAMGGRWAGDGRAMGGRWAGDGRAMADGRAMGAAPPPCFAAA